MKDLIDCQGPPCDVGGYFKLDEAKEIKKFIQSILIILY